MKIFKKWSGVVYIIISMVWSIVYVNMISDSMANDLFWPNLTPTGAQSYLLNLISRHLLINMEKSLDLFDPSNAIFEMYNTSLPTHTLWSSYPRSIIYTQLTTIQDAIRGFQLLDATYTFNLFIQYCWVDFDRRWEIAHTLHRQARCNQRYQKNGAVYLEAILRNVNWDQWSKVNYPSFMIGIGEFLLQSNEGRNWLNNVPNAFKSVDSEVAYWTEKRITNYILPWNNRIQIGIRESIAVINVFGFSQPLTIHHIPHSARDSTWTSYGLYWGFPGDLWLASVFNTSLVRNSTYFIGDSATEDYYYVYPFTQAIIHDTLGPLQSIDSFFTAPSSELQYIISTINSITSMAFQNDATLLSAYKLLPTLTFDPIPKSWTELKYDYFGGSPLCNTRTGTSFIQSSFSFDDVCGQPKPLQITFRPDTAFFAYIRLRTNGIPTKDACHLCLTTTALCLSMMDQLESIYTTLISNSTILDILTNIDTLNNNVEIVQLASYNSTSIMLRQNLIQYPWSLFGYIGLHEWVYGEREVISFEGDAGIFTVLSERLSGIAFAANQKEIPNTTSQYLWSVIIATSGVLVVVAIVTIIIYIRHDSDSSYDLFFFNRIVGPVWLGRPLMLIRSSTAIIILSTSPIVFDTSDGFGRFYFEPRSFGYRLLLASEASWLTDVTTDLLLVFTQDIAQVQGSLSSLLFWLVIVCVETYLPIEACAVVERRCSRENMDIDLTCTSGMVTLGSFNRAIAIVVVNLLCVLVATLIAKICRIQHNKSTVIMLPASALAFCSLNGNIWTIDASITWMCGMFRFYLNGVHYILDTILWIIFTEHELSPISALITPSHHLIMAIPTSAVNGKKQKLLLIAGLLYLIGTALGSISYIQLAGVNFGNDFWWANFNSTGALTFIVNWYDKYRIFTPNLHDIQLHDIAYSDIMDYSHENTVATYSPLFASIVQYEVVNQIKIAIRGLRNTDGCLVPWIATQYCWLDLDQKYTMANSELRQMRCEKYKSNGAVYLEAPLRNVKWIEFESCWGDSFEIGIARHLYNSNWLDMIKTNTKAEADEIDYWLNHNITSYTTQWQNYKSIGLIDTFTIVNAFGISYPINLQTTNGSFRLNQESSMKMYWSFANDLSEINSNGSGIAGMSLLRESGNFAFQNTTLQNIYILNNTLSAPLTRNRALFASQISPFGSIDIYHVPIPLSLLLLTRDILENLSRALATNGTKCQKAFESIPIMALMLPVPTSIKLEVVAGGSFLCDQAPYPIEGIYGMLLFFSFQAACDLSLSEFLLPKPQQVLFALIASGIPLDEIPTTCSADQTSPLDCINSFQSALEFITTFMPTLNQHSLREKVIQDVSQIQMMQYISNTTTSARQLYHQPLLDISDPAMIAFGWMYLYDWAIGVREVVQIDGDYISLSVISTFSTPTTFAVDAMEVPHNLSAYCRALCQYVSFVLVVLATIAGLYLFLNRFTTEGYNLFATNRVGALVWIGRPLLLVRSFTALAILSTAPLELQLIGNVTVFATPITGSLGFLTKLLAAGEVNWLVFIIQDIAMVFTKDVTASYGPMSSVITMFISIYLSITAPVIHQASIHRQCAIDVMDYQIICSSGTLVIGSIKRFMTLVAISFGVSIVLYIYCRCRHAYGIRYGHSSGLLSCGAKYLFKQSRWIYNDVYYIDYSSAVLTGLIIIPNRSKLYVFDVKSWRIHVFDHLAQSSPKPLHLQYALPLIK
ncbi:hypothetical protein THRCLA_02604 [Thraustotheca clavata]|uniref:Uncharacterized protein n=1 Tax=Thraustotheca clavata TaxID=74557 RepID=A0A1W0A5C1_9STRA|nr:hypothetical protein THRCLA_02604 [Thraustotheca clavata]